jgi:hypothetical protein
VAARVVARLKTVAVMTLIVVGCRDAAAPSAVAHLPSARASVALGGACTPAPAGLLAWWRGDGNATDAAGGRNGAFSGTPAYAPGAVGQAFSFSGENWVEVPDDPAWTLTFTPFTWEMWVNLSVAQDFAPFVGHDEGPGELNKWIFWFAGGYGLGLNFHLNGALGRSFDANVPWSPVAQQWYHLAVTKNGSVWTFYMDGAVLGTATDPTSISDPAAPLTIGRAEGFLFNGLVDEVSLYNRALTAAEIRAIYSAGSGGKCPLTTPPPVTAATPTGSDVSVTPTDPVTGESTPVGITFGSVTTSGTTTVTTSTVGSTGSPPPPDAFKLGSPPTYYDISTTAGFAGAATVCVTYADGQYSNESKLRLLHHNAATGKWEDITAPGYPDTQTNTICGLTSSFSPFLVGQLSYPFSGFFQPVDNPGATNVTNKAKAGSAIPVKFGLGGDLGLDVLQPGFPKSAPYVCSASPEDAIEQTVAASTSGLSYDPVANQYIYVWKTNATWAGTCRKLTVTFRDGTTREALFHFVK